jgi:plastocyanin
MAALGLVLGAGARAADLPVIPVTIKDHHFDPAEIHVKAGQPTILQVTNADGTAEEFESGQLAIEKVIAPGATAKVRLRPLGPGRYNFIGEYHEDTAKGVIVSE